MQAVITRLIVIITIFLSVFVVNGQQKESDSKSAATCITKKIENEVQIGTLMKDPLVIINGYLLTEQNQFGILKELSCEDIEEVSFLSSEKAQLQFDGEKARRGIVLVSLRKKASRIWKKQFKSLN